MKQTGQAVGAPYRETDSIPHSKQARSEQASNLSLALASHNPARRLRRQQHEYRIPLL